MEMEATGRRVMWRVGFDSLRVASPFLPGILLSRKPPMAWEVSPGLSPGLEVSLGPWPSLSRNPSVEELAATAEQRGPCVDGFWCLFVSWHRLCGGFTGKRCEGTVFLVVLEGSFVRVPSF